MESQTRGPIRVRVAHGRVRAGLKAVAVLAAVASGVLLGVYATVDPPRPARFAPMSVVSRLPVQLTIPIRICERPEGVAPRARELTLDVGSVAPITSDATHAFVEYMTPHHVLNGAPVYYVGETITLILNSGGPDYPPTWGYLFGGPEQAVLTGSGNAHFVASIFCVGPGTAFFTIGWADGYGDNVRVDVVAYPFDKRPRRNNTPEPFTDCGGPDRPDVPERGASSTGYAAGDNGCTCMTPNPAAAADHAGSVFTHNGEEHQAVTDMYVPGRGDIHFRLAREYRSRTNYLGPIGHSWQLSYEEHLAFGGEIPLNNPSGHDGEPTEIYHVNGFLHEDAYLCETRTVETPLGGMLDYTGAYAAPPQTFRTLEREGEGWILRDWNGFKRHFDSKGRLSAHEDRWGNRLTFNYPDLLSDFTATDPFGRVYTFKRNANLMIESVTDFAGRKVSYVFDDRKDLVAVTTPAITGTSTGNDFPSGRTTIYAYNYGFSDPELNHNLATVTLPHEVARGGPPSLVIHYGPDDKVTSVDKGGLNDSGVPAGGTWSFVYETAVPADMFPLGSVNKTTVTDPDGNVTVRALDARGRHLATRLMTRGLRPGEPAYYETTNTWNDDSLPLVVKAPLGDMVEFVYEDSTTTGRRAQRNLKLVRRTPDAARSAYSPFQQLVTSFTYEPVFNQVSSITDERAFASAAGEYTPPIGTATAERHTSRFFYDYQEGSNLPVDVGPIGNVSAFPMNLGDLNGDGLVDQRYGDLIKVVAPSVTLLEGSNEALLRGTTTQEIVSKLLWNDAGQLVKRIDPEGNVTVMEYNPENAPDGGAPIAGQTSTLPRGYLKSATRDAETSPARRSPVPPTQLKTSFSYDPLGRVIAVVNPRGVGTGYEWNACDELVSVTRAQDVSLAVTSGQLLLANQAFSYVTRSFYNENGWRTKVETENRNGNTPELGPYIEQTFTYDILGHVVAATSKVDATHTLTTSFRYTGDEHLSLVIKPEGNKVKTVYDERDLVFKTTAGFESTGAAPSTVTRNYDANGNLVEVLDPERLRSDGTPTRTTFGYDGYDRLVLVTDAVGGQLSLLHDPVGNVVTRKVFGHPANQPSAPITLLSETRFAHDELSRTFQVDAPIFLAQGFTTQRPFEPHEGSLTPADGLVTTRVEFDALSRKTFLVEDDRQTSKWLYDGASRLVQSIDPVGNSRHVAYDRNSNATSVTSVEISPESLVAAEVVEALYVWDSLDRMVRVTDNAGQTATVAYDSRDQVTDTADAVGPLVQDPLSLYTRGPINDSGNTAHTFHDGLGRVTKRVIDLRVGGQGGNALDLSNPASPNGTISTHYMWDGNSRLAYLFDDKGNATHYEFDELDRAVKETAADATFRTTTFDRNSNPVSSTDANGTSVARTFDDLHRLTNVTVTPSTTWHVGGTLSQTFGYDGASRLTKALDTHADARVTEVAYAYDSLSRVLEEVQDGRPVSSAWAGDGRRVALTYASGTRLDFQHDANKRLKSILDQTSTVAHWDWIGPGMRPLRRAVENGVTLTFLDDTGLQDLGYDSAQRVTRMRYRTAAGASLVDLGYGYDRANNRTFEARNHENRFDSYTYDSAYRLTETAYNVDPNAAPGALPDGVLNVSVEKFTLDGVNNRLKVQQTLDTLNAAGTALKKKTVNSVPNATNEYVSVGNDTQAHDPNGNLLDDGKFTYRYDFRNLLISVEKKATGKLARYRYDALARRVEKVWGPTAPDPADEQDAPEDDEFTGDTSTQRFVHDGHHVLEQRNANDGVTREWVYGVGVDEPVRMTKKPHKPAATNYYYLQNAIGSVVAITDAAGNVLERYKYLAFGKEEIQNPDGTTRGNSVIGNPYRFQGRWRDSAEGSPLTFFRNRYYHTGQGRFTTRDPIGAWGDRAGLGNAYAAFGANAVSLDDPFGFASSPNNDSVVLSVSKWVGHKAANGVNWLTGGIPSYFGIGDSPAKQMRDSLALLSGTVERACAVYNTYRAGGSGWLEAVFGVAADFVLDSFGVNKLAEAYMGNNLLSTSGLQTGNAHALSASERVVLALEGTLQFVSTLSTVSQVINAMPCFFNCFVAGTRVQTEDGEKNIEDIRVGDRVLSKNEQTGEQGFKKVTRLFPGSTKNVCAVTVRICESGGEPRTMARERRFNHTRTDERADGVGDEPPAAATSRLRCTPEHPFFVRGRGWVAAARLEQGQVLVGVDGGLVEVVSAAVESETTRTFNFEVEDWHTYFVAAKKDAPAVWVHNACANSWNEFQLQTKGAFRSRAEAAEAWRNLKDTVAHLDAGTVPSGPTSVKWGAPFKNYAGDLPGTPGALPTPYQEFRVAPLSGTTNAGPFRVVQNAPTGERWYTWTHYGDAGPPAFVKIR